MVRIHKGRTLDWLRLAASAACHPQTGKKRGHDSDQQHEPAGYPAGHLLSLTEDSIAIQSACAESVEQKTEEQRHREEHRAENDERE